MISLEDLYLESACLDSEAWRKISNSESTLEVWHVYDGNSVIAETNDKGKIKKKYILGPRIDETLAQKQNNNIFYLTRDGLGSTRELTDESGDVKQRYDYDAFGVVTVLNKNGKPTTALPKTNYLFTGREFELETGLYNYRNRYYHPGLGRFVQTDPIGEEGGINLYQYCGNDPVGMIDPFGLIDWVGSEAIGAKLDLEQTEYGRNFIDCVESAEKKSGKRITVRNALNGDPNRYYPSSKGRYGANTIIMTGRPTTYISSGTYVAGTTGESLIHELQHALDHLTLGDKGFEKLRNTPVKDFKDALEKRAVDRENELRGAKGGIAKGCYPRTEY